MRGFSSGFKGSPFVKAFSAGFKRCPFYRAINAFSDGYSDGFK